MEFGMRSGVFCRASLLRLILGSFAQCFRYGLFAHIFVYGVLDAFEIRLVLNTHQSDSLTVIIGPSCTPYTMHVILHIVRYIKVNDDFYIVNVYAA